MLINIKRAAIRKFGSMQHDPPAEIASKLTCSFLLVENFIIYITFSLSFVFGCMRACAAFYVAKRQNV